MPSTETGVVAALTIVDVAGVLVLDIVADRVTEFACVPVDAVAIVVADAVTNAIGVVVASGRTVVVVAGEVMPVVDADVGVVDVEVVDVPFVVGGGFRSLTRVTLTATMSIFSVAFDEFTGFPMGKSKVLKEMSDMIFLLNGFRDRALSAETLGAVW